MAKQQRSESNNNDTQSGTIKRLVRDRGFGFVLVGGQEYFFHRSECTVNFDALQEGAAITCVTDLKHPKGPRASQVGPA